MFFSNSAFRLLELGCNKLRWPIHFVLINMEKIDAGVQANVDALDRYVAQFMQAGNAEYAKLLQMVKKVYLAFYTDTPSADNDIKISY